MYDISANDYHRNIDELFVRVLRMSDDSVGSIEHTARALYQHHQKYRADFTYKLYICLAVLYFKQRKYAQAIRFIQASDEIRAGGKIARDYERVKSVILAAAHSKLSLKKQQAIHKRRARLHGLSVLCMVLLAVACTAIGMTVAWYAELDTRVSGLYDVASGLFLAGLTCFCLAVWQLVVWRVWVHLSENY